MRFGATVRTANGKPNPSDRLQQENNNRKSESTKIKKTYKKHHRFDRFAVERISNWLRHTQSHTKHKLRTQIFMRNIDNREWRLLIWRLVQCPLAFNESRATIAIFYSINQWHACRCNAFRCQWKVDDACASIHSAQMHHWFDFIVGSIRLIDWWSCCL